MDERTECQPLTRNIRKPGDMGKSNFCTFTKNCNGLISLSFETPASAYCQPLVAIKKNDHETHNIHINRIDFSKL